MAVNLIYQFASDNVAPNVIPTVNTGTVDGTYPAANLVDLSPITPAKLTTTTGSWVWDFGAAQRVDLVAIIHHNLTAGLDVRLQGHASNSWGAPTCTASFTIPVAYEDSYPANPWLDMTLATGYSAGGFRYWRLVVVGANAAPVAIGEVWLGKLKRSLEPNIKGGYVTVKDRRQIAHQTNYGTHLVYDLGVTIRGVKATLDDFGPSQAATLESWWRDTKGGVRPFLVVPRGDQNEALFVRWASTMQNVTWQTIGWSQFTLVFDEVGRGLYL